MTGCGGNKKTENTGKDGPVKTVVHPNGWKKVGESDIELWVPPTYKGGDPTKPEFDDL